MRHSRWSNNDRYLGPFTFSKSNSYRPIGIRLDSGDNEDDIGCDLKIHGYWFTFIINLPPIIKPYREKVKARYWDKETIERMGRDWYYDYSPREYGFNLCDDFFQLYYGRQTHDSNTDQTWCCFLPWTQWRQIRHELYDVSGYVFWSETQEKKGLAGIQDWIDAKDECPFVRFEFEDYDGERLTARTFIEEIEWEAGTGWWKWLSWFRKNKINRSLYIEFSRETGSHKGSWKGGTVGHSIEMLVGEWHQAAFKRYCDKHNMTFIGRVK